MKLSNVLGWQQLAIPVVTSCGLVLIAQYDYSLFHTLAELSAVFIAFMIFVVHWHTYRFTHSTFLMLIAIGYLGVGMLDLQHTMTFPGFSKDAYTGTNRTSQFWISARVLEACTLIAAPLMARKTIQRSHALSLVALVTIAMSYSIFSGRFPDTYIDSTGLTPFKIYAEYGIICLLLVAIVIIRRTPSLTATDRLLLSLAIVLTVFAELLFSSYVRMNDGEALAGHILKILSYWLVFKAILVLNLRMPFESLQEAAALDDWHYEYSPIPIWIVDLTGVIQQVDSLGKQGITDFRAQLQSQSGLARSLMGGIQITKINRAALQLLGTHPHNDLQVDLARHIVDPQPHILEDFVTAIHTGDEVFRQQLSLVSGENSTRTTLVSLPIPKTAAQAKRVEVSVMDITAELTASIEAERTAQALGQSAMGTVNVLAATIELRDPYAAGHQQQVAQLAEKIARQLGWDEHRIQGLQLGALIHNIGTVYIPAEILNRPGGLESAEMEIVRSHAQMGADIIARADLPWPIHTMILQHHERIDGSGYPNQLKGDAIIIEARILAVADVVVAMSSHRPYRPAAAISAALDHIESGRGVIFDSTIVDITINIINSELEFSTNGTTVA